MNPRARAPARAVGLLTLLVGLPALGACDDAGPEGAPEPGVVARAGADSLGTERLARLLVRSQPLPLDEAEARRLARHWIEMSALGRLSAHGEGLLEPGTVDGILRFERRELLHEAVRRVEAPVPVEGLRVDSLFDRGDLRLLGHLFRASGPDRSADHRAGQLRAAREMRETLIRTRSLDEANVANQDPAARRNGGLLLVERGDLPPALEEVAWSLPPGGVSAVLPTELGYHVLVRPNLSDVRAIFARMAEERLHARAEGELLQGLWDSARVESTPAAAEAVRGAARAPFRALGSERVLVRWSGEGRLTLGEVAQALFLLSPEEREAVTAARAVQIEAYLRRVVVGELLEGWAERRELGPPDSALARLRATYRTRLREAWEAADVSPDALAAAAPDPGARAIRASERVDAYLDGMAAGRRARVDLPPLLSAHLLSSTEWSLDEEALRRAVARAGHLLGLAGYQGPGTGGRDTSRRPGTD